MQFLIYKADFFFALAKLDCIRALVEQRFPVVSDDTSASGEG